MAVIKKTKRQLVTQAQNLGIRVDDEWTKRDIVEAIAMAEQLAAHQEEDELEAVTERATGAVEPNVDHDDEPPGQPEPSEVPEQDPELIPSPKIFEPEPAPQAVAPSPAPTSKPQGLKSGQAGRYKVLSTITLPRGPVHDGEVELSDAEAKSLVAQNAVVHVDDYPAYLEAQAKHGATDFGAIAVKKRVPVGAGRYRTTCSITRRRGMEIQVLDAGQDYDFTDAEVENLAKQGAIEYPPETTP